MPIAGVLLMELKIESEVLVCAVLCAECDSHTHNAQINLDFLGTLNFIKVKF